MRRARVAHYTNSRARGGAEEHILTVYIHAHMDEDNFDTGRVSTCPDLVPDPQGTFVPACAYNVFYRMKDERFWIEQSEKNETS